MSKWRKIYSQQDGTWKPFFINVEIHFDADYYLNERSDVLKVEITLKTLKDLSGFGIDYSQWEGERFIIFVSLLQDGRFLLTFPFQKNEIIKLDTFILKGVKTDNLFSSKNEKILSVYHRKFSEHFKMRAGEEKEFLEIAQKALDYLNQGVEEYLRKM